MEVSLEWFIWSLTLLLMVTAVVPVKFAAEFVGAKRATFPYCAMAVILASAMIAMVFYLVGDTLASYLISFLLVILAYRYVLEPPPGHSLWLVVVAFAVQIGIVTAFVNYGRHAGYYTVPY